MIGAIAGDIIGSRFEGSSHNPREFRLFSVECDFTNDTVCTVAVADAILNGRPPAESLRDWVRRYPARGYGGGFKHWAYHPSAGPYNSFGNGAAMRVSPVGLLATSENEAAEAAASFTAVTHNHPE